MILPPLVFPGVLQHLHDSVSEKRSAYNNSADVRSVLKTKSMALKTFFKGKCEKRQKIGCKMFFFVVK